MIDADTLRSAEAFEVQAHVATPIGDGSTAMLFESSPVVGGGMPWRLVDLDTGDVTAEGHLDTRVYASVASPDGSTVAAAGEIGEIITVDVSTGAQRISTSHAVEVWSLNYSDDGEALVSAAADGAVSLWDASTLDLLGTVHPPRHGKVVQLRAVHRRHPRRGDRVVRRRRLPLGDRPRPCPRVRLPDGRPRPDRGGVGAVPARPALPVGLPAGVTGSVLLRDPQPLADPDHVGVGDLRVGRDDLGDRRARVVAQRAHDRGDHGM